MIVDRVFCYSADEAKKNDNYTSRTQLIIFIVLEMILVTISVLAIIERGSVVIGIITILIGVCLYVVLGIISQVREQSKLQGFATDTDGNVYMTYKLNNGEEFAIGGIAAGGLAKSILDNKNVNSNAGNLAGGLGSVIGIGMSLYSESKSKKIMQNPEIIAKMEECAETTTGASVTKFLKVHSYTENSHKIKIKCDYEIMNTGKIKYNKRITIYKSFNYFDDLKSVILNK